MASEELEHVQATPPAPNAFLDPLLERVRAFNAREPRHYVGMAGITLRAEMPRIRNPREPQVLCMEPPAVFEAVNAHFSTKIHAFFSAMQTLEDMADKQPPDEPDLIRPGVGLQPEIEIAQQSFDFPSDCLHRSFYSRRLAVQNVDSLPLLNRVTKLRVFPEVNYASDAGMELIHQRPVSPRVPLELTARLPHLRELDCPYLWERLPVAFWSRALRIFTRDWEGPWRDARAEFARGVRHLMPVMPSSFTKARFWFWNAGWGNEMDQAEQMPDLVTGASQTPSEFEGMDPVSLGLRELGSRLEELDTRALITPDLFPPGGGDGAKASNASSSWPRMRHLTVEFHPCAPTGRWYFSGPRGEDPCPTGFAVTKEKHYPPGQEDIEETHDLWSREEDEWEGLHKDENIYQLRRPDMFRIRPIEERINPLLLAFVSSLRRETMPCLEDAELFTWLTWLPSEERRKENEGTVKLPPASSASPYVADDCQVMFRWGVKYEAPKGDDKGKVTWQVGENWRPKDEIIRAFEDLLGEDRDNMEWQSFEYVEDRNPDRLAWCD
ncbi:hypothetical protein C7999DRAFT_17010 [Corynascus novoguineensis]|uniref:Uncharacterized protein n=1 Tax=Corynascus novoguineensis TaxID=1126955 RepID=A0AAN7HM00_9PEZI|nr:hypothetical protein C7999DRAFT_17010 [Corynascus novoguineensis]